MAEGLSSRAEAKNCMRARKKAEKHPVFTPRSPFIRPSHLLYCKLSKIRKTTVRQGTVNAKTSYVNQFSYIACVDSQHGLFSV